MEGVKTIFRSFGPNRVTWTKIPVYNATLFYTNTFRVRSERIVLCTLIVSGTPLRGPPVVQRQWPRVVEDSVLQNCPRRNLRRTLRHLGHVNSVVFSARTVDHPSAVPVSTGRTPVHGGSLQDGTWGVSSVRGPVDVSVFRRLS